MDYLELEKTIQSLDTNELYIDFLSIYIYDYFHYYGTALNID